MELTQHLYLKIGSKVRGPVSANVLYRMFKNKEIDSSAMFSFDGNKWASVTKLFSAKTRNKSTEKSENYQNNSDKIDKNFKVEAAAAANTQLPELTKKLDAAAGKLEKTFSIFTYLVFAGGSIIFSMLLSLGLRLMLPEFSPLLHIAVAVVPAILLAAVGAHTFGNYYMSFLTGLSLKEKYSLALHIPWESAPQSWSLPLKKWLYCNDWLVDNNSGNLLPYVRVFVTGKAPVNVEEEVDLWQNIMQGSRKKFEEAVGHSVRELACLQHLPMWTSEITPGMNLHELEKSLGMAGRKWAVSLLKRAALRKESLKDAAQNGNLDDVIFEFYCSKLRDGRECLMVIISSHAARENGSEDRMRHGRERAA